MKPQQVPVENSGLQDSEGDSDSNSYGSQVPAESKQGHGDGPDRLISLELGGWQLHIGSLSYIPAAIGFSLSASLLAVINKWALVVFPFPAMLTALQYLTSSLAVLALGAMGVLDHDPITWEKMKKFMPAALIFYLSLFTNVHLLQVANVDTMIVFRSCTPILVAVADFLFRDQPWPGASVFGSLFVIFAGAIGYVVLDKQVTVLAYSWALAYLVAITTDMVFIKHLVHHIKLNTWGLVLYNNLLALALSPFFFVLTGEAWSLDGSSFWNSMTSVGVVTPILVSCAFGLAISFFAFACRKALSATAFTVLGVTNKLVTISVNTLLWDRHASPGGILCLLVTVVGGVAYQQATVAPEQEKSSLGGEEKEDVEMRGLLDEKEDRVALLPEKAERRETWAPGREIVEQVNLEVYGLSKETPRIPAELMKPSRML